MATPENQSGPPPGPRPAARPAAKRVAGGSLKTGWEQAFLDAYALDGSRTHAARAAGVSVRTIRRREDASPEFAEQVADALEAFRDSLERLLLEKARGNQQQNVIALLARLKAERPERWNDKLQVEGAFKSLSMHVVASAADAASLLREMLAEATDATRAQLTAAIASAPIPLSGESTLPPAAPKKEALPPAEMIVEAELVAPPGAAVIDAP